MSAEAKVGLLVICTALIAVTVAVLLSDALRNLGAYTVRAQFSDVLGLDTGSPVRLGGKNIGWVSRVEIDPHKDYPGKPVAVEVTIRPDYIVYPTDRFEIKQGALVGEKFVSIVRPEDATPTEKLQDGDVVSGASASGTEVVMDEARQLIVATRATVDAINTVLADVQMQEDLKETVANLREATAQAVVISEQTVKVVETFARASSANEERLAAIMQNMIAASDDIEATTAQVEKMLQVTPVPAQMAAAGENIVRATEDVATIAESARERLETTTIDRDLEETVATLREASANLQEMTADAAELAGDEQIETDIRATLENVRNASESLSEAAAHAEELISDEEVNEDLRVTVGNLRETSESSRGMMDRAGRVMTDIEGTLASVREAQEMITDIQMRTRLQIRGAEDDGLRADTAIDLRPGEDATHHWRVGIRDVGDADSLDLQYGTEVGSGDLHTGLFGGELGAQYNWRYAPGRALETELYDPDHVRLDLRWRMSLRQEYDLLLGVEHAFGENDPMLGVRYRTDY